MFFFSLYNNNSKKGDIIKSFPSISAKIPLEKIEDRCAMDKVISMVEEWEGQNIQVFWGEMAPCEHLVQIYDND